MHGGACAKQLLCALTAMRSRRRQAVNDAATVFGTAHFDDYQQQGDSMAAHTSVGALAGAWHTYALEWTLESLHWCGALPHAVSQKRQAHWRAESSMPLSSGHARRHAFSKAPGLHCSCQPTGNR